MSKAKEFMGLFEQDKEGKVLHFVQRGTDYEVSLEPETLGHFMKYGEHKFNLPHPEWVMLGVSKHPQRGGVDVKITPDVDPKSLVKGYVWDKDHGTTRRWGGGGEIRITNAYVEEGTSKKEFIPTSATMAGMKGK